MGGVDSWFDDLDEKKVSTDGYIRPSATGGSSNSNYQSRRLFNVFAFYIYMFFLSFS
jgi:hypothetical protein